MGTSSPYGGPKGGLEPSWVDDVELPGGNPPGDQDDTLAPRPSFGNSRASFTRFTNSGNVRSLSSAVSGYLASTGGGAGAARRMPHSIRVASGIAGLASRFASGGPAEALRQFELQGLAGRPAVEVFEALLDELCPDGGTIDEAVARDAMIEAISEFAEQDLGNFDELTVEQLGEFLCEVVTRCITTKVINEIGTNSLHGSSTDIDFRQAEEILRDYVSGAVLDALGNTFNANETLTIHEMDRRMNDTFANAFEILRAILEDE